MKTFKFMTCLAFAVAAFTASSAQARTLVTANFSVYVAPPTSCTPGYWPDTSSSVTTCGSDSSGAGTQSAPWATVQKAITTLYSNYDFQGLYAPAIVLAAAPAPDHFFYGPFALSGRLVGQPGVFPTLHGGSEPDVSTGIYNPFVIRGDPANTLGVIVEAGANGFASNTVVSLTDGAAAKLTGFTLAAASENSLLLAYNGSFVDISDLFFGNAGVSPYRGVLQAGVAFNSTILVSGTLSVGGSAEAFMETGPGGQVFFSTNGQVPITVNVMGSVTYELGMFAAIYGPMELSGIHFTIPSGSTINGRSVFIQNGGVINTSTGSGSGANTCSPSYFPANTGGVLVQDNAVCR